MEAAEGIVTFCSAMTIFVVAPVLIRAVLPTEPMPDSPLRRRLEAFCRRHKLRYRNILVWHTHSHVGNAAVMGLIPQVRYILLSDLLLETMSEQQIEAVFAHEVGHVVHRHMLWYLAFFKVLALTLGAIAIVAEAGQQSLKLPAWLPVELLFTAAGTAGFLLAFGFVSRRMERQADVFAAREIEALHAGPGLAGAGTFVGMRGAQVFNSALKRVAEVNNMPIAMEGRFAGPFRKRMGYVLGSIAFLAGNWMHGSIATRMRYLHGLSEDPSLTRQFDRFMAGLYAVILMALTLSAGTWLTQVVLR
jgi:STE24 endopeptidase